MKVIAAINGSLVSESCAFLALQYAKYQNIDLVLLHVKNQKDTLQEVEKSALVLSDAAAKMDVNCETVILTGYLKDAIPAYCNTLHIDTLFCSTRVKNRFITNAFSEHILRLNLNTNIAVVRIVHYQHFKKINSIVLPIKETKLSVYKFTFLASLASAYESDTHIYSVTTQSKNLLDTWTLGELREKSAHINFELRHYVTLSRLMPFNLNIRHDFSTNETNSILKYMATHDSQLVIIGGRRLSFFSRFRGEQPIEKLMRETSSNLIAFYPKED